MWLRDDKEFNLNETEAIAFVYKITNLLTDRQYIGKKLFYTHKYKMVNKKRKKIRVESDWKDYWSSSEELKKDIQELGKENFKREILLLANSKGTVNYLEARMQMDLRVLENPNLYYNGIINCRVNRKHLKDIT